MKSTAKMVTLLPLVSVLILSLPGCARTLHGAASRGDTDRVRTLLIDENVDVNLTNHDGTALHLATAKGHAETVLL